MRSTKAVIEQNGLFQTFVDQERAKLTVQFFKELLPFLFIEMNNPIVIFFNSMSLFSEISSRFKIRKTFACNNERDIILLIEEYLTRGEGILVRHLTE